MFIEYTMGQGGKKKIDQKIDSYHSKVAFPRGAATSVTKWARSLKGITTTFTTIE